MFTPITRDVAVTLTRGTTLYHVSKRGSDGRAVRCRVNGRCKTWVREPTHFRLPVKHGLSSCFYIHHESARCWSLTDPTVPLALGSLPHHAALISAGFDRTDYDESCGDEWWSREGIEIVTNNLPDKPMTFVVWTPSTEHGEAPAFATVEEAIAHADSLTPPPVSGGVVVNGALRSLKGPPPLVERVATGMLCRACNIVVSSGEGCPCGRIPVA